MGSYLFKKKEQLHTLLFIKRRTKTQSISNQGKTNLQQDLEHMIIWTPKVLCMFTVPAQPSTAYAASLVGSG